MKAEEVYRKRQTSDYTLVQIHPKSTYADIRQNLHIYLFYDTFSRILDSVGIKNWRAKGRPTLDPEDAKRRYDWAKVYHKWSIQWELIIFSDECSVELGKGGRREWVFRLQSQKWLPEMAQTYRKSSDISMIV
jgi:hypothetical protein